MTVRPIILLCMLSVAFGEDIQASLLRCYDGDTCTVDLFDPEGTMPDVVSKAISVRLLGIDTPEKRAVCRLEYCIAIKARDYLVEKLGDNDIMLKNVDRDKYFRLLANLAYFEPSTQTWVGASQMMIDAGFANEYHGGTKDNEYFCDYSEGTIYSEYTEACLQEEECVRKEKDLGTFLKKADC